MVKRGFEFWLVQPQGSSSPPRACMDMSSVWLLPLGTREAVVLKNSTGVYSS